MRDDIRERYCREAIHPCDGCEADGDWPRCCRGCRNERLALREQALDRAERRALLEDDANAGAAAAVVGATVSMLRNL